MITLEMIDQVVDRTGVSYARAKKELEENNEDVVQAIISIEDGSKLNFKIKDKLKKTDVIDTLKSVLKKGNATKIIVEKDEEEYLSLPVTFAVPMGLLSLALGALLAPIILALGVGAYVTNTTVKVKTKDGKEINVNEETEKRVREAKKKVSKKAEDLSDEVIDITEDVSDEVDDKKEEIEEKVEEKKDEIKKEIEDKRDEAKDKTKKK